MKKVRFQADVSDSDDSDIKVDKKISKVRKCDEGLKPQESRKAAGNLFQKTSALKEDINSK